jgi:hypothetical protein
MSSLRDEDVEILVPLGGSASAVVGAAELAGDELPSPRSSFELAELELDLPFRRHGQQHPTFRLLAAGQAEGGGGIA